MWFVSDLHSQGRGGCGPGNLVHHAGRNKRRIGSFPAISHHAFIVLGDQSLPHWWSARGDLDKALLVTCRSCHWLAGCVFFLDSHGYIPGLLKRHGFFLGRHYARFERTTSTSGRDKQYPEPAFPRRPLYINFGANIAHVLSIQFRRATPGCPR